MTEFVQFLVLAFTALVWWLAKRDLTARAARLRAASSAEVDQLKETVEALTAALEERVTKEEKRLSALIAEARALQSPLVSSVASVTAPSEVSRVAAVPVSSAAVEAPVTPIVAAAPKPPVAVTPQAAAPSAAKEPASPVIAEEPAAPAVKTLKKAADEIVSPAAAPIGVGDAQDSAPPEDLLASDAAAKPEITAEPPTLHQQVMEAERRAALVRAQLAIGVIDPIEIVRRTGLPRGEVELLIGLRSLRIEPAAPVEAPAPTAVPESAAAPEPPVKEAESVVADAPPAAPVENDRYAAIYSMIASGVTDSTEIARRTGMGRGEVELILGLRARNVL
ncbi:MAG: hypothetical protein ABIY70_23660 [Capsulimonas sp.]|uniref:hypothetical protein n=1 Tax=Capsulimonas sp. TaxID=2494211 RepID=UPI0032661185